MTNKINITTQKYIVLLFVILFQLSCSSEPTDKELLLADKTELKEQVDSDKVMFYKISKLFIRTLYTEEHVAVALKGPLNNTAEILAGIDSEKPFDNLSLMDMFTLIKEYRNIKAYAESTNEDDFPTVLETLITFYDYDIVPGKDAEAKDMNWWNQDKEHAAFSVLAMLSKDLGRDIALYECSLTNPEKLTDGELKAQIQFYRGFLFSQERLLYLAESEYTSNIDWMEDNTVVALPNTRAIFQWKAMNAEDTYHAFHAMNYLLRGVNRLQMSRDKDEKRALEDLEIFVADFEHLGVESELVWAVQIYLALKKEDSERAIVSLEKLKKSDLLSTSDVEDINESIGYLEKRETGKVLNGAFDKAFLGKLITRYVYRQLQQIDWEKYLEEQDVESAEKITETYKVLKETAEKSSEWTDTDKLIEEGEDLLEDGEELLDKAKDFWK